MLILKKCLKNFLYPSHLEIAANDLLKTIWQSKVAAEDVQHVSILKKIY
jgi:hypothetical protein